MAEQKKKIWLDSNQRIGKTPAEVSQKKNNNKLPKFIKNLK